MKGERDAVCKGRGEAARMERKPLQKQPDRDFLQFARWVSGAPFFGLAAACGAAAVLLLRGGEWSLSTALYLAVPLAGMLVLYGVLAAVARTRYGLKIPLLPRVLRLPALLLAAALVALCIALAR